MIYGLSKQCYSIKLTTYARTDSEEILFEQGIFKTKDLAVAKIKELANILATAKNKTVYDESTQNNIEVKIRYSSCMACPNYDIHCCGECYSPIYEFTIVDYDFIE